jgi:mannose-6-phosphate isomerase-like protein (cupin superfamily)
MVKQGTTVINSITKDEVIFLETNVSSGGKHCKIKWLAKAGGGKPPMHIHLTQEETFEIISGRYTYEYEGEKKTLGPGERITFPKEVPHNHYNDSSVDCEMIQTVSPALDFEDIFMRINKLFEQGKVVDSQPPMLEVMVWLKKYEAKTYLAGIPVPVQNILASVLAPIGRMLGHGG